MMKVFLLALAVLAMAMLGLCVGVIFKGKFPDTEISTNVEMRKRGIVCAKEEEMRIWGRKHGRKATCADLGCSSCSGCMNAEPKKE
ncbi:MAG: hypothetical protein HUJ94_05075 [Bacteroidales bacterium]|nr:hypothetical protein [Bacteroidales bacterium]